MHDWVKIPNIARPRMNLCDKITSCFTVEKPPRSPPPSSEAEFLDVTGTKVLRVFLLSIHTDTSITDFTPLLPRAKVIWNWFVMCTVHSTSNLKSENPQNYAQKPERNCMFMNSASVLSYPMGVVEYVLCAGSWQIAGQTDTNDSAPVSGGFRTIRLIQHLFIYLCVSNVSQVRRVICS